LIHATSSHLFVTTLSGDVYSSPIQAISWTKAQNLPDNLILSAITSSGSNVYLGSNHGVFQTNDAIHWNAFNAGLANTNITSLTSNNTFVFAGTNGGGVFRSGLVTNSWTAVNSGLPDLFITSLFTNGQYLIAGYKGGVHVSTSSGYQWLPPNVELYIPNYTDIIEISFNITSTVPSTRIFIATAENMIYSNSISELPATASDPSLGIQHAIKNTGLLQVYPNPTNGSFTIDASELNEKLTSISIYDYSGKMIDTFSGDNHQFNVHYNPGIYLIHVCTTNNDVLIKKIIIQ